MTDPTAQRSLAEGLAYLQIDYPAETEDPARIFRAMAKLIDAFYATDRDLLQNISGSLEPVLYLERVEAGSLRAWIRTAVRQLDDDALKNLDWKPFVGQYLVEAKHRLLRWLASDVASRSRGDLSNLQRELESIAPAASSDVLLVQPLPAPILVQDLRLIADATEDLKPGDTLRYVSETQETAIADQLKFSSEEIRELLTDQVFATENQLVLLIKKPDYLGNSRWEFKLGDHPIEAKIVDQRWLDEFRAGMVPLSPGDALRAQVRIEVFRGFEGNVIDRTYTILRVLDVVRSDHPKQSTLDFRPGA